jgi:hypothetical protein
MKLLMFGSVEQRMQEYRTTLLWLTHGNHKDYPPTAQEARHQLEVLQNKMTGLFASITSQLNDTGLSL